MGKDPKQVYQSFKITYGYISISVVGKEQVSDDGWTGEREKWARNNN